MENVKHDIAPIRTYYNIAITNKCNRGCPYCLIKDRINKHEDKLNKEALFNYLYFAKKGDLVEITGGEPTGVAWLEELIKFLNDKQVYIILRTNGYKLFKNVYEWLVAVFNPHDAGTGYTERIRKLLRPTDVIMGEDAPVEWITDENKQNGCQPPPLKFEGARHDHPYNNGRFISYEGLVWAFFCDADNRNTTLNLQYAGQPSTDLGMVIPICGGCEHLVYPWTFINRLGKEDEVSKELAVPQPVKEVYRRLQDNESRSLFETYYRWRDADKWDNFKKWNMFISQLFWNTKWIRNKLESSCLYILGANEGCGTWKAFYPNLKWKAYVDADNDPPAAKTLHGLPVISASELKQQLERNKTALCVVGEWWSFWEELSAWAAKGVSEDRILYNDYKQYFSLFKPRDNEVFVDAGNFGGDSTKGFFDDWLKGKPGKAYCFEPLHSGFTDSLKEYAETHNAELVDKVLWNHEKLLFKKAVTVDEYFKDKEPVTFLKLDVEGAEEQAILGAKEIIKRDKPRIALYISASDDDWWKLPYLITEIVPEYKFWIRRYTAATPETIIYGAVK